MNEELTPQKDRFLREVEQKLLRRELDARLLEDGLLHVKWNGQPLCSVDRDGIVRFRPADITGPEVDRQLRMVTQIAAQTKEYMRIFEWAPALKAVGLEDTYKVLADFGDAVLAGQLGKKGARFVTWEWDFDRQGIHAGHYIPPDEMHMLQLPLQRCVFLLQGFHRLAQRTDQLRHFRSGVCNFTIRCGHKSSSKIEFILPLLYHKGRIMYRKV